MSGRLLLLPLVYYLGIQIFPGPKIQTFLKLKIVLVYLFIQSGETASCRATGGVTCKALDASGFQWGYLLEQWIHIKLAGFLIAKPQPRN